MNSLSSDILVYIFSFIPPLSLCDQVKKTCKTWCSLVRSEEVWKKICIHTSLQLENKPSHKGWKWFYFSKKHKIGVESNYTGVGYDNQGYEGFFVCGNRHGWGKITKINDENPSLYDSYEGWWVNGKEEGQGTYTWPNSTYTGGWKNGDMYGYGEIKWVTGSQYRGNFVKDDRNGYGEMTFDDGRTYKGGWKNDTVHGHGIYTWPDGSTYIGGWKKGWRHGEGCMWWSAMTAGQNNREYNGPWFQDLPGNAAAAITMPWLAFFTLSNETQHSLVEDWKKKSPLVTDVSL